MCEDCANKNSLYCVICEEGNFYMDEQTRKEYDLMCDLMCGGSDDESL